MMELSECWGFQVREESVCVVCGAEVMSVQI